MSNEPSTRSLPIHFEEDIAPFTVLIEAQWTEGGQPCASYGSGAIIASNDQNVLVATARHVVTGCNEGPITWRISRGFEAKSTPHSMEFTSQCNLFTGRDDAGFLIPEDDRYDVAQILLPQRSEDGSRFVATDEKVISLLEPKYYAKPGVPIAWAGFPCVATNCCNRHVLCLYRGIISATIADGNDPPIYLVDGHIAQGVSGGPVWSIDSERPSIVGIVSQYWPHAPVSNHTSLPGLCHIVPINPMGLVMQSRAATRRSRQQRT